ncbi:MAG: class C sortase [Ruminococcus sp.]|nr:class C sortase [Ruminococcus sp.]
MKKKHNFLIIAIILLIVSGLIFIYPTLSNFINQMNSDSEIRQYNNNVKLISQNEKDNYLTEAKKYNENLSQNVSEAFSNDSFNNMTEYENILNFGNGQIGNIRIPKIDVNLPVFHDTENALREGAVHTANTSFPIGGESTHSVISAHTAFPGRILFDNLTEMEIGDVFYITVLDDTLKYKVVEINIVKPDDVSKLQIVNGKDYVTLVTCTPYSVNTHRLLVKGERIIETQASADILTDDTTDSPILIGPIVISSVIFVLLIVFLIVFKKRNKCPSEGQEVKNEQKT